MFDFHTFVIANNNGAYKTRRDAGWSARVLFACKQVKVSRVEALQGPDT